MATKTITTTTCDQCQGTENVVPLSIDFEGNTYALDLCAADLGPVRTLVNLANTVTPHQASKTSSPTGKRTRRSSEEVAAEKAAAAAKTERLKKLRATWNKLPAKQKGEIWENKNLDDRGRIPDKVRAWFDKNHPE